MSIRAATIDDIDFIVRLEQSIFPKPYSYQSIFNDIANQNSTWLIFDDGTGYINFKVVGDETEILRLAIAPDLQRKGLGEKLLDCLTGKLFLEVSSHNFKAIAFYRKKGFTQTGLRKNYYGAGDDAILMNK